MQCIHRNQRERVVVAEVVEGPMAPKLSNLYENDLDPKHTWPETQKKERWRWKWRENVYIAKKESDFELKNSAMERVCSIINGRTTVNPVSWFLFIYFGVRITWNLVFFFKSVYCQSRHATRPHLWTSASDIWARGSNPRAPLGLSIETRVRKSTHNIPQFSEHTDALSTDQM